MCAPDTKKAPPRGRRSIAAMLAGLPTETAVTRLAGRTRFARVSTARRSLELSTTEPIAPHGGKLVDLLVPEREAEGAAEEAGYLPKVAVGKRELSDLEMLAVGALSPLTGFMGEKDYRSVIDDMHLSGGLPWTIPVTLSLDETEAKMIGGASRVALTTG